MNYVKKVCAYFYHALDMNDQRWECFLSALASLH